MPKYLIKRLIEKSGDDMKNETGKREKLIMSDYRFVCRIWL